MRLDQTRFHDALLDPAAPVPEGLIDGRGRPAGRRFNVYRNNVAVSLTEALEVSFPAIRKLVGAENFKAVAGAFLRRHPPRTPLLMRYGAAFPEFLAGFEPLAHLGYLADVARLEQALREAYHAPDATPADASILERLAPEALARTALRLAPAVRLVASDWPIHAIWRFNMEENAPAPAPRGETVLITRPEFDPQMTPLSPAAAAFVAALLRGAALEEAFDTATAVEPEFEPSATLALLLGERAITAIDPGEISQ